MQGCLIYNKEADCMDIRYDMNRYHGGLHCGDCLDVMVLRHWLPTRISNDKGKWVLVGVPTTDLVGLRVRT